MNREPWVPISQDTEPGRRRQRMRTVEAVLRRRRVEAAGHPACHTCGGRLPMDGDTDVCDCGTNWTGTALTARCLTNARNAL